MPKIRIPIDSELAKKVTARWDTMMAVGGRRAVQPPRTDARALHVFLTDALAELERLDRDAGGAEARRAAIETQGSIFARSGRADAALLAGGDASVEHGMHCSSCGLEAAGGESGWAWVGDKVYCDKNDCRSVWAAARRIHDEPLGHGGAS